MQNPFPGASLYWALDVSGSSPFGTILICEHTAGYQHTAPCVMGFVRLRRWSVANFAEAAVLVGSGSLGIQGLLVTRSDWDWLNAGSTVGFCGSWDQGGRWWLLQLRWELKKGSPGCLGSMLMNRS
jgi:hypothetical protein